MTQIPAPSPSVLSRSTTERRAQAASDACDRALEVHRQLLEVPVWKRASFLPSGAAEKSCKTLQLDSSHRSVSQRTKRSATQSLSLQGTTVVSTSPLVFTSSDVLHTSYSRDGTLSAVFRSNKEGKGLTLEVWHVLDGVRIHEVNLKDHHGDCYFDETFGPPTWSPCGLNIVYAAEPQPPTPADDKYPLRSQFEYTPDFGELFTGKRNPCLFLVTFPSSAFHLGTDAAGKLKPAVHRLTDPSTFPSTSFGQAILLPTSSPDSVPRVLATGYSELADRRKLGVVYCTNRPTAIYELTIEKVDNSWKATSVTRQSPDGRSARSARLFLPPSSSSALQPLVVFLSNPSGGPHNSCATLHAVDVTRGITTVLVDTVNSPSKRDGFPGLYVDQLPQNPFLVLNGVPYVCFSSVWRSRQVPLLISLKKGDVKSLAPWPEPVADDPLPYLSDESKDTLESVSVLTTDGSSLVVALSSGLTCPPKLIIRDVLPVMAPWKVIKSPKLSPLVSSELSKLDWTVLPLPKFEPSEILIVSPIKIDPAAESTVQLPPLVTVPHGGPHSVYTTSWSAAFIALAVASYRVAIVNYPGSIGFGQDFVDVLPPKIGQLEVDATLAASHYLNALSLASRTKGTRFFQGGSHGGFIGTHLSARYPDEYDAFVLRNPVTDLASMAFATDIPDWTFEEATLPYPWAQPPSSITPSENELLRSRSPLTYASAVKSPTLLLVGKVDRRVPPDQSRTWYHALKASKVKDAEMLVFPENGHALDSNVETEVLNFEYGLRFLQRFTTI